MQKHKNLKIIFAGSIAIFALGITLSYSLINSCNIQHVSIISDVKKFEQTQDPEFCDGLVNRILTFNEECDSFVEILDCG